MSFDRYSQDLAYTFIYRNEVSIRICQAESAEQWADQLVTTRLVRVLLKGEV